MAFGFGSSSPNATNYFGVHCSGNNIDERLPSCPNEQANSLENVHRQIHHLPRTTTSNDWMTTVPDTMPWLNHHKIFQGFGVSNGEMHHNFNEIMKISDEDPAASTSTIAYARAAFPKKRPLNIDDGPTLKQRITEAKIAKSFNSLHISDDYRVPFIHSDGQRKQGHSCTFAELEASIQDDDDDVTSCDENGSVFGMSQEVKDICKNTVPQLTLANRNRPSKAVVLWKPPGGFINELLRFSKVENPPENEDEQKEEKSNISIHSGSAFDMDTMDF